VFHDIPPGMIAVGTPAKVIRERKVRGTEQGGLG